MGNRAHSPELVVAHIPIVACVRSCVLAVIHEPRWLFWLVVVCVLRGLWAMVKGGHRWVVVAGCGQWMVAGDRSWAVGGRHGRGRLCPFMGAGTHLACDVACHIVVVMAGGGCERMVGGGGGCWRPW